jgi:hypothetical protein
MNLRKQVSLLAAVTLVAFYAIFFSAADMNLPGNHQGYAPEQPIAFSHRVHSGDLQMSCLYCHPGAEKSPVAGIPAATTCMNCHRYVTGSWDESQIEQQLAQQEDRDARFIISSELAKLYQSVEFDTDQMSYQEEQGPRPIEWIRVHQLPDFVYFDHRSHVTAGVSCQTCHGPVETMERVTQVSNLSMGWCVNCHRDVNNGLVKELEGRSPSTECGVCHY